MIERLSHPCGFNNAYLDWEYTKYRRPERGKGLDLSKQEIRIEPPGEPLEFTVELSVEFKGYFVAPVKGRVKVSRARRATRMV